MTVLPVILAMIIAFLLEYWRRLSHWLKWDHLPGFSSITSLPFIGHGYKVGDRPLEKIIELRQKFGGVFRIDLGPFPTIIVTDFKEAEECLKSEDFTGRHFYKLPSHVASR